MSVTVHADDIGLTGSHTRTIESILESGGLERVSALATGTAFNDAFRILSRFPELQWTLHWNLVDGRSILAPEKIPQLVDNKGRFRLNLSDFLLMSARPAGIRKACAAQIRAELEAQWDRFAEIAGPPVRVDSHRHVHLMPFVAPIAAEVAAGRGAAAIRQGIEPGRLPPGRPAGILRRLIYNTLARRSQRIFRRCGLGGEEYVIGIRDSGRPQAGRIQAGIRAAVKRRNPEVDIELLFHPGSANEEELRPDVCRTSNAGFYRSAERQAEARFLAGEQLSAFVRQKPQSWIQYWNGNHAFDGMMDHIAEHFVREIESVMPLGPDLRLLDFGCGSGAVARRLSARVGYTCGVDTSETAIASCRAAAKDDGRSEYLVVPGQPGRLPDILGTRRFDRIICLSVVQYFSDAGVVADLVRAAGQVANTGAEMLIADIPGGESAIHDARDLLAGAARNGFLPEAMVFIIRSLMSDYGRVRSAAGFLSLGRKELEELISREGWDADILQGGLTFSRTRHHLRIRL